MTETNLNEYIDRVWQKLETMIPGDVIDIKETARNNPELFVECCKYYMREHEWQDGLSFSKGFRELRKYDLVFNKHRAQGAVIRAEK